MGKSQDFVESLDKKLSVSRRSFVKSAVAVGAAATLYGCSKDEGGDVIFSGGGNLDNSVAPEDLSNEQIYYASCVHNCGTGVRCVSKLHVVNGRIVRVTSDDSDFAYDGSKRGDSNLNNIQYNDAKSLTCPKGRAFKYRVYHPGKLRYALKQTKQRGDINGFIRIPVAQAMKEIAIKYRKTVEKYGAGAVHNIYGTSGGYSGQGTYASYGNARTALTAPSGVRGGYGDYSYYQYHYGQPLTGHPGAQAAYTKSSNVAWQFPAIAGVVKNVVSWGANMLTTVNSAAWSYIRAFEKLKANGGKAWFVGPEFTDTGVTCHTDWVQLRNYTDCAMIMAMMYEMIVNTFDTNGNIVSNPWLDVNYLDTMVYGFFASPEYWVHTSTGEIITTDPSDTTNYRHVEEVKPGECLAAYLMGKDDRLTKALYSNTNSGKSDTYTAAKFVAKNSAMARAGLCSWTVKGTPAHQADANATEYLFKKSMMEPKKAEWAEAICGTPAATIRQLAQMYCDPAQHPIFNEWAGGTQKQANGSINIWAITALMSVTKTFGLSGETFSGAWAATNSRGPQADGDAKHYVDTMNLGIGEVNSRTGLLASVTALGESDLSGISCKEWFNAIKLAFNEYLTPEHGYTGKYMPDWNRNNRYYTDDGSVKATVLLERDANGKVLTETIDRKTYYKYARAADGVSPVYAGIRMIVNAGGGIMLNQHMNTNDLAEMYRAIPALNALPSKYEDADGLCLVTFDLYFSPTARYMDYVLPGVSSLEASEYCAFGGQSNKFYRPPVVKPLGDATDGWRMAYEAYKAQSDLGEFSKYDKTSTGLVDSHFAYIGTKNTTKEFKPVEDYYNAKVDDAIKDPSSKFYGMTREQVYANQFTPAKNNDEYICTERYETRGTTTEWGGDSDTSLSLRNNISKVGQIRKNLDEYLADGAKRVNSPFVFTTENGVQNIFNAGTYFNVKSRGGSDSICPEDFSNRPKAAGRFQVYNGMVKFDYEHLFSKYHGWLAQNGGSVGQTNLDHEGDLKVYPIPMYFDFQDSFREAYNGFEKYDIAKNQAVAGPNATFFSGKPLTLSTTHDRFRVHSTHNENPYLRELNHRTANGGWASGNDWKEYCVAPERQAEGSAAAYESPMISSAINNKKRETASWHEIWMNTEDAAARGIKEGDLCRAENPIGVVRVIARVTDRCMKGHLNLHQGGWYDPNPVDGVDDGGCANTLIASYPSKLDHGNAQQFAYVTITKETNFRI